MCTTSKFSGSDLRQYTAFQYQPNVVYPTMFQQPQQVQIIPHIQSQQQQIHYNPVGGSNMIQSSFSSDPHLVQASFPNSTITYSLPAQSRTVCTTMTTIPYGSSTHQQSHCGMYNYPTGAGPQV